MNKIHIIYQLLSKSPNITSFQYSITLFNICLISGSTDILQADCKFIEFLLYSQNLIKKLPNPSFCTLLKSNQAAKHVIVYWYYYKVF